MRTLHKRVICALKLCFTSDFLKHSKNHSDESTDDIDFLHDVSNKRVLSGEVELIQLKRVVKVQNICVERDHLLINNCVEFCQTGFNDSFLHFVVSDGKHDLSEHERALQGVAVERFLTLGRQELNLVQNGLDVVVECHVWIFLVLV
jgi:hypothetical protein